ncbi:hypothetical protein Tco_1327118 [Tanacetum coccineum]
MKASGHWFCSKQLCYTRPKLSPKRGKRGRPAKTLKEAWFMKVLLQLLRRLSGQKRGRGRPPSREETLAAAPVLLPSVSYVRRGMRAGHGRHCGG